MKAGFETMKHYLQRTFCAVGIIAVLFASESLAVQKESQAEKEANLKGQALGGLFNRWTFDQQKPEEVPSHFSVVGFGEGDASVWTIQADAQAPSVPNSLRAESSCQSSSCYRLLVAEKFQYEYPDISVRMRFPAEGAAGQGGLVIGFQDEKNFYAAIVDLASKKIELVRVLNGQVTVLEQKDITPKAVDWHFLRVQRNTIISKDVIETSFDGSLIQSIQDQSLGLGRVGLVVLGNSSLHFDNLYAIPLFSQRPLSSPAAY
jgi:hypothetical protein